MIWNLVVITALGVGNFGTANNWLPINVYSNDPFQRMEQLLIDSENPREFHSEWRRGGWIKESPPRFTPYRIHGGVAPAASAF